MPNCLVHTDAIYRQCLMKIECVVLYLMKCQREPVFQTEVWLYWGLWSLGSHDMISNIANQALVFMLHGLCKIWKRPVAYCFTHESVRVRCLSISWRRFVMPATVQDWKLLPLWVKWFARMPRSWNIWVLLKSSLSSGFMIENLQLYIVLPISVNIPATLS